MQAMARLAWILSDNGDTLGAVAWSIDDFAWAIRDNAPQVELLQRFWTEVEAFAYNDPYFPRQATQAGCRFERWMMRHGDGHLSCCAAVEAADRAQLQQAVDHALLAVQDSSSNQ